jgi:hypothetical protein
VIDRVTAILLISPDARALAEFYKNALELPLEDEVHQSRCTTVAMSVACISPFMPAPNGLVFPREMRRVRSWFLARRT